MAPPPGLAPCLGRITKTNLSFEPCHAAQPEGTGDFAPTPAHGRIANTPFALALGLDTKSLRQNGSAWPDKALDPEQGEAYEFSTRFYNRSHPTPSWPKPNSSGRNSSAKISSDSARRGPGRLKY